MLFACLFSWFAVVVCAVYDVCCFVFSGEFLGCNLHLEQGTANIMTTELDQIKQFSPTYDQIKSNFFTPPVSSIPTFRHI